MKQAGRPCILSSLTQGQSKASKMEHSTYPERKTSSRRYFKALHPASQVPKTPSPPDRQRQKTITFDLSSSSSPPNQACHPEKKKRCLALPPPPPPNWIPSPPDSCNLHAPPPDLAERHLHLLTRATNQPPQPLVPETFARSHLPQSGTRTKNPPTSGTNLSPKRREAQATGSFASISRAFPVQHLSHIRFSDRATHETADRQHGNL
ncbi:hypothetical protein QBC39DRAFT_156438 [Podospora conica]|nr:hypothetical protein QBC39DRAFT_156438 [Schizothecium conicum]